jgi:hypothetical protein
VHFLHADDVEATWTQALADWIGAHTRAFAAIGRVPRLLVPYNPKVAIIKACVYEPQVNRTYAEMAAWFVLQCVTIVASIAEFLKTLTPSCREGPP